jgi:hypothetical protein
VFIVVVVHFVIDSVRKILDTSMYRTGYLQHQFLLIKLKKTRWKDSRRMKKRRITRNRRNSKNQAGLEVTYHTATW